MTCKDCKHFYNREPKPWRDIFDLGYCDHSREGKIEINKYCPVNKWCDNKFEPKDDLLKMRSATKEERESVNKYIDSISESTGHNFYDSWESVSK